MNVNCQVDLTPLMATVQVAINVGSLPMSAREKLAAISYAGTLLAYLANAGLAQLNREEGAAPPLEPRAHGETSIADAFAYITRVEVQSASESNGDVLHIGDRVRSIYLGRTGTVLKVYPDGFLSVGWDDGESLGPGRVARDLLKHVEAGHGE